MVAVAASGARPRRFYILMAIVCALAGFGFFSLTYWIPLAGGRFAAAPVVHIHALIFSAWLVLLLSQAFLAATGRLEQHRALGMLGVALATAMVFVGLWTALHSLDLHIARGNGEAAFRFAIVPISGILLFAALTAAAFANVSRPEIHKRLIVVATIGIVQAAVARLFFLMLRPSPDIVHPSQAPPPPVQMALTSAALVDLVLIAAIVFDWRTRGRPHPAYLIAGGLTVMVQVLQAPLSETAAWRGFVEQLLAIATH